MSNKHPHSQTGGMNRKADDFRIINGLSKAAKTKLHAAGILTFAQLAAMSPHEILAAIGNSDEITTEQILQEDWIGQAARLTAPVENFAESSLEPSSKPDMSEPEERRMSFALELKLNEDNSVKQTRVLHVESEENDAEENWAGWDETRLLNFIAHRGRIALPPKIEAKEMKTAPVTEVSVEEKLKKLFAKSGVATTVYGSSFSPSGDASLPGELPVALTRKLEVFAAESNLPAGLATSGESYCVKVSLDSTEIKSLTANDLAYSVTVYAKPLNSNSDATQPLVIGESEGVLAANDEPSFAVNGAKLSAGAYRLRAAVRFNALGAECATPRHTTAFVEGGLLQVF